MNRITTIGALCLAVSGCATTSSSTTAQSAYALGAALDTAEKAALIYLQSPLAQPAAVAEIKTLDTEAYAAVAQVMVNGNNATADQVVVAEDALSALTTYLTQNRVK